MMMLINIEKSTMMLMIHKDWQEYDDVDDKLEKMIMMLINIDKIMIMLMIHKDWQEYDDVDGRLEKMVR